MKLRFKRKQIIIVIILAFLALVVGWTVWGNLTIGTTHYEIAFENLPSSFEGYKIAQISDLHNAKFGENNARIIEILHEENPDMIAITGDLIDSNRTDIDIAVQFMQQAVHIAPCYYVTGNHEAWIGEDYQQLEKKMIDVGVRILHDEVMPIYKDGESIQLIGLDDPDFTDRDAVVQDSMLDSKLKNLKLQDGFKLLLSHRPETVHSYVSTNVDLVLSGHAHGGQFWMPFIGGIVAPNQGLFPEYDAGVFDERGTTMVVSRGIGNSIIPVRLNNRPEIVIVKLQPKS